MTIKEFYELIDGGYEATIRRISKEKLLAKFIKKFQSDSNYNDLKKAMQEKDYQNAFIFSHTLKGIAFNLGFDKLGKSCTELTDRLRENNRENYDENELATSFLAVKADYEMTEAAIKKFEEEEENE